MSKLAQRAVIGQQGRMTGPNDLMERAARAQGYMRIAGVDEVGRGPLAGPVKPAPARRAATMPA